MAPTQQLPPRRHLHNRHHQRRQEFPVQPADRQRPVQDPRCRSHPEGDDLACSRDHAQLTQVSRHQAGASLSRKQEEKSFRGCQPLQATGK